MFSNDKIDSKVIKKSRVSLKCSGCIIIPIGLTSQTPSYKLNYSNVIDMNDFSISEDTEELLSMNVFLE
uniref:Uncharacterized protein n=1 Tax=Lepeophtheirus salmonis TaxID=72036 RepID=A0A0K2SWL6_LEPSM